MTLPTSHTVAAARLPLTVLPRANKVALGLCGATLIILAGLMAAADVAYIARQRQIASIQPANPAFRDHAGASFVLVILNAPVVAAALLNAGFSLLVLMRSRAWLEGVTLVRRDTFRTRRSDLATVPVSLARVGLFRIRCLIACESATRRKARLPLRYLTAPELASLASAIVSGGRLDAEGWQVAAALRQRVAALQVPLQAPMFQR